jgi:hypothetical protein
MKLIRDKHWNGELYWKKEGVKGREVHIEIKGLLLKYSIMKYGSHMFRPKPSKDCYGRIVRQNEDEIEFGPISKKEFTG